MTPSTPSASSTPPAVPTAITLPLNPALRTAYLDLQDKYQLTIMATADVGLLQTLIASKLDVDNILTKDNMYRLNANSALFAALQEQIRGTNADLEHLKDEIAAIAGNIATAGEILGAIGKVLSLASAT